MSKLEVEHISDEDVRTVTADINFKVKQDATNVSEFLQAILEPLNSERALELPKGSYRLRITAVITEE